MPRASVLTRRTHLGPEAFPVVAWGPHQPDSPSQGLAVPMPRQLQQPLGTSVPSMPPLWLEGWAGKGLGPPPAWSPHWVAPSWHPQHHPRGLSGHLPSLGPMPLKSSTYEIKPRESLLCTCSQSSITKHAHAQKWGGTASLSTLQHPLDIKSCYHLEPGGETFL